MTGPERFNPLGLQLGDRVLVQMHEPGTPPRPYDAAGEIASLQGFPGRPDISVLATVLMDDRALGRIAIGLTSLRRENTR